MRVFGFGTVGDGELGIGGGQNEEGVFEPIEVSSLKNYTIRSIACGAWHSLFLLDDGSLWSCGSNDSGQLGHETSKKRPHKIDYFNGNKVVQVSAGFDYSAAVTHDGHLFTWGSNSYGQLGLAPAVKLESFNPHPMEVNLSEVIQVACGVSHTLVLTADGTLYSWGMNIHGQLGTGHGKQNQDRPQIVHSLKGVPIRVIKAGYYHSVALSVSGAVFTWGRNNFGQLGLGDIEERKHPAHVKTLRYQRIIDIACGQDHTAAVSLEGRIFTFGAGQHGQLGNSTVNNDTLPRQVMELMGSRVTMTACGRGHTLALVGNRVYVFGLAGCGQLGLGKDVNQYRLVPTCLRMDQKIIGVFAGGDHSFIVFDENASGNSGEQWRSPDVPLKHLTLDIFEKIAPDEICNQLQTVFASVACLNCSFLQMKDFAHFGASSKNPGINMDSVMEWFSLCEKYPDKEIRSKISKTISESIEWSLLADLPPSPPDIEAMRLYLILPWCPLMSDVNNYGKFILPFGTALNSLAETPMKIILLWWEALPTRHFNRVLKIFKQVVQHILGLQNVNDSNQIESRAKAQKTCLDIMRRLNEINARHPKIPFDSFYINELPDKVDIRMDYVRWIQRKDDKRFSFCDYPFTFNAQVKTMLLQTDAAIQMHMIVNETNRWNVQALFLPFQPQVSPYLEIKISRNNILPETLQQLQSVNSLDLKRPLRVKFIGEEADDAGGVKKEFFMLLFQQLLNIQYGMFVESPESHMLWFTPENNDEVDNYSLVGMLVGLAIYNSVIVQLPFPLALYKKILLHSVTLEDLKELSPVEAKSLESILDYEDDDFSETFELTFEITVPIFGHPTVVELKPNGKIIPVTKENRQEYVDLYVKHRLVDSVKVPFDAFSSGFHRVVTSRILNFFQPLELMEMVVGNENYDWMIFEKNTEYKGDYWANHPTIQIFWEVFHSLALEQKKKFLRFLTGTDRIPLLGMKEVKMYIQPVNVNDDYYPVAHTCFNLLDLPKFTDAKQLRKKLLEAIEHTEGFTLV